MPKWGLTPEMIDAAPWGFAPELGLLAPAKVVTDPVHGDIYLSVLEMAVVDSRPFQRLRRVRQLGMTPEVYPGATNTRFAHSLGALRAAQDLLDIVLDQRNDPHGVRDLFEEWQVTSDRPDEYLRKVGEVVVAARLGGLLHDIAHVPYGHSIEDDLGILPAHDKGRHRFEHLWRLLGADLQRRLSGPQYEATRALVDGDLATELRPLILSKEEDDEGKRVDAHQVMRYPFVADLVGNTICADLIDYLPRDHLYSGLPMELGHRFLDAFFVTPTDRTRLACRMALNIVRENRERTDIITELLKYLRYRYELTERVLVHHAKLSADAMVGKALELWFDELRDGVAAQITAGQGGAGAVAAQDVAASGPASAHSTGQEQAAPTTGDNNNPATGPDPTASSAGATDESARKDADSAAAPVAGGAAAAAGDSLDDARGDTPVERARKRMQRRILMHGDDGLLEYLRDWTNQRRKTPPATARPERLDALEGLIEGLLRRDLFRLAGRSSTQQASAPTIYADYGRPEQRRALEEDAARFAGIAEPWKVCIWLPPPAPRLKSAEVLVFDGSEIVEFNRSEQYASKRGEDIYDAHARLWAVAVYIHRSVDPLLVRRALVRLAQRMEVRWDREVEAFGRRVLEWPDRLGAREVCDRHNLGRREDELRRLAREQKVARGPEDVETFDALYANYEVLAEALQRQ